MATLTVSLDRFEGTQAVLRLPDGQELVVDQANLPANVAEGAALTLSFSAVGNEAAQLDQARALLTDILQGS